MRKLIMGAVAAAALLSPLAATQAVAQPYGYGYGDRYDHVRRDHDEWRWRRHEMWRERREAWRRHHYYRYHRHHRYW